MFGFGLFLCKFRGVYHNFWRHEGFGLLALYSNTLNNHSGPWCHLRRVRPKIARGKPEIRK